VAAGALSPRRPYAVLLAAVLATPCAATPELAWRPGSAAGEGEVRLCRLADPELARLAALPAADAERLLSVKVGEDAGAPALWGRYSAADGCWVFRPRHAVAAGLTLRATLDGPALDALLGTQGTPRLELRETMAAAPSTTRVVGWSPAVDTLPENVLRLYVAFSAPMSLRGIEAHVHLLDGEGREVPQAFVEVPGGLWDASRTRLTLILHPGRVKSGLQLGDALGRAVQAGSSFTLVIDGEARDADGAPLVAAERRTWQVGAAEREPLDPSTWRLRAPANAGDRLWVETGALLDQELARAALGVETDDGENVPGTLEPSPDGRSFAFRPAAPWTPGAAYRLVIGPMLEDVAGNRLGAAFEEKPGTAPRLVARELAFIAGLAR
jgi:hypothetical protein